MADFATLVLGADTSGLERGERAMRRIQQEGRKTERVADEMTAAFGRAAKALGGMAVAYLSVSEVARASQTYQGLSNSLKGMGQTGAQAAATLREVNGIATRTRAPLEETARLYRRLSVAGADLGASSQDVARFAENVGLALGASGSSASEASDALTQLSQAMAGGKVQAEEFNSILDGAFPIAQAAARGIDEAGGSVGRLRKLVNEGEISSREFFDAILSQTDDLEAAFGRTVPTIAQGVSVLGNNFTMLVGVLDQSSGASEMVARAILAVGDGMAYLVDHADTVEAMMGRVASVGIAVAGVFATRAAVSIGTTYVTAAASAVRSTIALEMALGATSARAAVASAATKALAGSMRVLRGALIATGIGALVVGAGEMIYQFGRLKEATGGWGNALSLLGEVASGVWEGIQTSAQAIPVGLESVWMSVKAGFLGMISDLQFNWFTFVNGVSRSLASVGADAASSAVAQYAEELGRSMDATIDRSNEYAASAASAKAEAASLATQGFDKAREAAAKLTAAVAVNSDETEDGTTAANRLNTALEGVEDSAGGSSKAMKDAAKAAKEMADEIERLEFDADPVKKYNAQVAHLDELLKAGLSDRAYQYALQGFNDELASSLPLVDDVSNAFADWLVDGARDFKSFAENVFDDFKRLIANMIATAARNKILLSLGLTSTGTASAASTGTSSLLSGASSLMGGLTNTIGGLSSAISSVTGGLGVVGSALGNFATGTLASISGFMSGGFSGLAGTVSAAFANGGMATALGSVLGPVGLIAGGAMLAKSLFGGGPDKTFNVEERGLELFGYSQNNLTWARSVARGNDGYDGNVVSKKDMTLPGFDAAMMAAQNQLFNLVSDFGLDTAGVIDAALAEAATRDKGWLLRREINLDGLSDEQKTAEILSFISDATGELAAFVPGLEAVTREGENGYEALIAMQDALAMVNSTSEALGNTLLSVSLAGGDAARSLLEAFGSADAYSSAVSNYVSLFYTEAEQTEFALNTLTQAMESLGASMPRTRAQYMGMIEAADLSTESGRNLYTALVSLASQFDAVLPSVESFSSAMASLSGGIVTGVEAMISDATDSARAAAQAANDWFAVSDDLRDLIRDLSGQQGGAAGYAALSSQIASTFKTALGGDVDAARDFPALAQSFLSAARDQSATQLDYLRAQARVASQANMLAGVSELEGASKSAQEVLYEEQISILEALQSTLESGSEVTAEQLSALNDQLGSIDAAISEAQGLTYANLMKRLTVAVDLIPSADIPADLATLMDQAANGIESEILFAVTATDLTPDLRFLAVTGASEHIKTLDFVIGADISDRNKKLALETVSVLSKTVNFVAGAELTHDQMAVALAGNSELSRVVNVALAQASDARALRLALKNVNDYAVNVEASLDASDRVKRIVFAGQGAYAAQIEAAFSDKLTDRQRMVLLRQAGTYTASIKAAMNAAKPVKTLLDLVDTSGGGKVTLGGGFKFDPSSAFSEWYTKRTKAQIKDPMDALRSSVDELAQTIVSERLIAEAQATAQATAAARSDALATAQGLVDAIEALEVSTGVTLRNGNRDATLNANNYAATWREYGTGSDYDAFKAAFDGKNGLQAQLIAAQAALKEAKVDDRTAQKALSSLLSFDGGGYTGSGARSGGLDGKGGFLAMMHPRETVIDHTKGQSDGSAEIVAELREMRRENAAMRAELAEIRKSSGITAETSKLQKRELRTA